MKVKIVFGNDYRTGRWFISEANGMSLLSYIEDKIVGICKPEYIGQECVVNIEISKVVGR